MKGSFDYVNSATNRDILAKTYRSICLNRSWDFIRHNPVEQYIWSTDPIIFAIKLDVGEISDSTQFLWTMRQMKFIAQNGEKKFQEIYLKNNQKLKCICKRFT